MEGVSEAKVVSDDFWLPWPYTVSAIREVPFTLGLELWTLGWYSGTEGFGLGLGT